jgi:hypothetical protein
MGLSKSVGISGTGCWESERHEDCYDLSDGRTDDNIYPNMGRDRGTIIHEQSSRHSPKQFTPESPHEQF